MKRQASGWLIGLMVLCATSLWSQEAIVPLGGDANGAGGSISFSVGQIAYSSAATADYTLTQGVQQPYEVSMIVSNTAPEELLQLNAYPNPTTHRVVLDWGHAPKSDTWQYILTDWTGRMLSRGNINDVQTSIALQDYPTGTYLLSVQNEDQVFTTFQIIKH